MKPEKQPPNPLTHQPVESSSVQTIGYDETTQELHIAFKGSGMYVYQNVSKFLYEGLMQSSSKGKFLHQNIKGRFEHEKNDQNNG